MPQRILIVADEDTQWRLAGGALEAQGFTVASERDYQTAYGRLLESPVDLVVISLAREADGVGLIRQMRTTPALRKTPVLVIAEWGLGQATLALSQGANAYEPGPLDATRLLASVERLLGLRTAVVE